MNRWRCLAVAAWALVASATTGVTMAGNDGQMRGQAKQLFDQGNYQEALELYQRLVLDAASDPVQVGDDLDGASNCLQRLNRVADIDGLREKAAVIHANNWRLLTAAGNSYLSLTHDGYIVGGAFERGPHRGGGEYAQATERDRVRALQLLQQALARVEVAGNDTDRATVHDAMFAGLIRDRWGYAAWRLQYLTDIDTLPDYEIGYGYGYGHGYDGSPRGAPVDEDGKPILYQVPASWDAAQSDGERWRWLQQRLVELVPSRRGQTTFDLASFIHNQLGVQTMAQYGFRWPAAEDDGGGDREGSIFALHELPDGESIARLANGISRFALPPDLNHLLLYQELAAGDDANLKRAALNQLANIYQNRRQFPRAAETWRQLLELPATPAKQKQSYQRSLDQIILPWGQFEGGRPQPAGAPASISLRFRNAKQMQLEAQRIDLDLLVADIQAYLKGNPRELDWQQLNLDYIGQRLVENDEDRYLTGQVVEWSADLAPLGQHFDRIATLTTPLDAAGPWLVTGKLDGGNVARTLVWLEDAVIVQKVLDTGGLYFLADARTGAPIAAAELDFFGYRTEYVDSRKLATLGRNQIVHTSRFTATTDGDGQVVLPHDDDRQQHQWLVAARAKDGRGAVLGFRGLGYGHWYDHQYNETKVFTITDRPVYRPGQSVEMKLWVRHAQYDQKDVSQFAGQSIHVELYNARGERVLEKSIVADAYGGVSLQHALPSDASLGVWRISTGHGGQGTFRVEEYKKPEFEVTVDAPTEPIALGEKFQATITAKYYFGAPVTEARVKYKVLRHEHDARWYPAYTWDWFYGAGYWWFGYDYAWYPGWGRWGCEAPIGWWWQRPSPQPELVAESEAEIGADGTLKVTIDTLAAKLVHGDSDHRYSITAEVVDRSRRTIVGTGDVLVARRPYKVYAWVDRGHYRTGDTIQASFSARTVAGKPVTGPGELQLLRVSYDGAERAPREAVVQSWSLATDAQGEAKLKLTAADPGQYRLSYTVSSGGHHIEGGYVLAVLGERGKSGSDFRFNALEIVADRPEYAPGDTVKLAINTEQADSTVLLFVRPANGVVLAPRVLRLTGHTALVDIEVVVKDMPNFFVEAVTVSGARVQTEMREIVVPPASRVLDVKVEASKAEYGPGEHAKVKLKLTDASGEPFVGSMVVSVYDKAVEYISGGSNVPEIKEFFWKWRRHHQPQTMSTLDRWLGNLLRSNETPMQSLGVFGDVLAELDDDFGAERKSKDDGGMSPKRSAMRSEGALEMMAMSAPAPAAMGMADAVMEADTSGANADAGKVAGGGGAALVEPTVRSEFADTAFWAAAITTDARGEAAVEFDLPENLSTWKIRAWGMGHGTRVGEASVEVVTTKDLLVRLQAPRFFVEKDEVVLSANVHNYLASSKRARVVLDLEGATLERMPGVVAEQSVDVPAGGEARVDWRVRVVREGEALVRMKALTDEESDAMEMRFPVKVHGQMKQVAVSAHLAREASTVSFVLDVPAERRIDDSRLEIRYSPSLAMAMVDALPYLVGYPYGCTEQTLSRFVPTAITQKILLDMGLDLTKIRDKQSNLNAQELGNDRERAAQWRRDGRIVGFDADDQPIWATNPVFDPKVVADMVAIGVARLVNMQNGDGGWGWFSGYGERSYAHTTAYVVHGLQIARDNAVAVPPDAIQNGVEWLRRHQNDEVGKLQRAPAKQEPYKTQADDLDAFVYMVLVDADVASAEMRDFLYRDRTTLSTYALAMYGLTLAKQKQADKLAMVKRNIEQYLVEDPENQTAYLNLPNTGYWWYWYGSEYEAHAYYLKLLARTEPGSPKGAGLVKYLLNNRKHGTYWKSTRDTAICLEAFADWIRATEEDQPNMTVELLVDGQRLKEVAINADNLFAFDNKLVVTGKGVTTGSKQIEIRRTGSGPLYVNAYLSYFSLEDYIKKAGLEVKVERRFYRLKAVDKTIKAAGARGQAVDQKVEKYERELLSDLALLKSGELVEIELEIESKNDYEYLVFEDWKAAGFEPVDVRSGYTGNAMGAYVEFRDDRVAFFVQALARGRHSVAYRVRAEIPGKFSALPAQGYAMYAPELKGNADEIKLRIED